MAENGPHTANSGAGSDVALARRRASGDPASIDRSNQCEKWSNHIPGPAEREHLAATLGATLRALRAEYQLGTRPLARRAAVARSTITRLERGERRPRRAILAALAYGLDPADPDPITARLCEAAGESLRPDTSGGLRRRARRTAKARRVAGVVRWRIGREAEETRKAGFALINVTLRKLPLDPWKPNLTAADLDRMDAQLTAHQTALDESKRLHNRADALRRALARHRHPLETEIW